MKNLDAKTIIGSKERPWFDVFQLNIEREKAAHWLGCEPHVDSIDGLGDADYWAIEFDCGLKIAFEFPHNSEGTSVYATEPVAQHVGRHLSHWQCELHKYPPEMFELDRNNMIERFANDMPELTELDAFQVWRQGDDGNDIKVGLPTSRMNADCWQAELESHKHKQIYCVSRVGD